MNQIFFALHSATNTSKALRDLVHWTCVCGVLREVEAGASRREAAECVEVSASSAIKWMQRLNETGSIAAKPSGGSISPLEAHAAVLLGLIAEQADLTLDEIVAVMRKRRIAGSRSAVWRRCLLMRPQPTPPWCGFAAAARVAFG